MKGMTVGTICVMLAAGSGLALRASVADPKIGRRIVWHDEFDGAQVDSSKWRFRQTMGAKGDEYVNDGRTVRVENGMLHLLVVKDPSAVRGVRLPQGLATHETMGFRYGYLEMRAKIPFRHGAWPSFWMQSTPQLMKSRWMSEVDIFEVFGSTNQVVSNLHKWGGQDPKTKRARHVMLPGGEGSCKRAFSLNAKTVNGEFHVYGFEWTPENMSFFVDGNRYATYPIDADHEFSPHELVGMECFHDFHSVILNDEIFMENHGWCPKGAALAPDAPLPIEYTVDWIRLYQKTGEELKIAKDGLFPQDNAAKYQANIVPSSNQVKKASELFGVPPEKASRRVAFVGNSITRHGPKPSIGWVNDCGMAASSVDKDYVHQEGKSARYAEQNSAELNE